MQSDIAGLAWKQEYGLGRPLVRRHVPNCRPKHSDQRCTRSLSGRSRSTVQRPKASPARWAKLAIGDLLSPASTRLLLSLIERVKSGPNRLKAGVPRDGALGTRPELGQTLGGWSTGYNDVGIMTAPDGTRYAVVVMIADTTTTVSAAYADDAGNFQKRGRNTSLSFG